MRLQSRLQCQLWTLSCVRDESDTTQYDSPRPAPPRHALPIVTGRARDSTDMAMAGTNRLPSTAVPSSVDLPSLTELNNIQTSTLFLNKNTFQGFHRHAKEMRGRSFGGKTMPLGIAHKMSALQRCTHVLYLCLRFDFENNFLCNIALCYHYLRVRLIRLKILVNQNIIIFIRVPAAANYELDNDFPPNSGDSMII